jgi:hypothetical protein
VGFFFRRSWLHCIALRHDALVDLLPIDGDRPRRCDPEPNLVALDPEDRDADVLADSDALTNPPSENQHSVSPFAPLQPQVFDDARLNTNASGDTGRGHLIPETP